MILPEIVSRLLSLENFTNAPVRQGGLQVIINPFPPNTMVTYTVRPLEGNYAQLGWITSFGSNMVPDAFTGVFQQYGSRPFSGRITQRMLDDGAPYFIMVTNTQPTELYITNTTNVNQYFETLAFFLMISSENDLQIVNSALRQMNMIGGS